MQYRGILASTERQIEVFFAIFGQDIPYYANPICKKQFVIGRLFCLLLVIGDVQEHAISIASTLARTAIDVVPLAFQAAFLKGIFVPFAFSHVCLSLKQFSLYHPILFGRKRYSVKPCDASFIIGPVQFYANEVSAKFLAGNAGRPTSAERVKNCGIGGAMSLMCCLTIASGLTVGCPHSLFSLELNVLS